MSKAAENIKRGQLVAHIRFLNVPQIFMPQTYFCIINLSSNPKIR